jgi:hypothetical protein
MPSKIMMAFIRLLSNRLFWVINGTTTKMMDSIIRQRLNAT